MAESGVMMEENIIISTTPLKTHLSLSTFYSYDIPIKMTTVLKI